MSAITPNKTNSAIIEIMPDTLKEKTEIAENWIKQSFPALFACSLPKPLMLGVYQKLLDKMPPKNVYHVAIKNFLSEYTSSVTYLEECVTGIYRYDLQGDIVGEITDEERAWAEHLLEGKK